MARNTWDHERRVVVLRRALKEELAIEDPAQQVLGFIEAKSTVRARIIHENASTG